MSEEIASDKKTIVLIGSSQQNWEDAVRNVVSKAARSVNKIDSIDVLHHSASANGNGDVTEFRVTVQISFEMDRSEGTVRQEI